MDNNYNQHPVQQASSTPILVFGILALALETIFGIIFGAIAISKAKKWVAAGNPLDGKAKAGKILGIIGLICGIITTIYLIIVIAGGVAFSSALSSLK